MSLQVFEYGAVQLCILQWLSEPVVPNIHTKKLRVFDPDPVFDPIFQSVPLSGPSISSCFVTERTVTAVSFWTLPYFDFQISDQCEAIKIRHGDEAAVSGQQFGNWGEHSVVKINSWRGLVMVGYDIVLKIWWWIAYATNVGYRWLEEKLTLYNKINNNKLNIYK